MKKWYILLFTFFIATWNFAQTVEFQVDMSVQTLKGAFDPAVDSIRVAGSFTNWASGAFRMNDPDGDTVYTITIDTFTVGDTLQFKFLRGLDGYEGGDNRELVVPSGDTVYFAYYNNDSVYNATTEISVTFSVNMEFEKVSGRFNPGTDTLSARGDFNGWSGTEDILAPSAADPNIYEITRNYSTFEGNVINYKYAYVTPTGTAWEGEPNKTYTFTADDINNGYAFIERTFNDATVNTLTQNEVTIKFTVNVKDAVSSITSNPFPSIDTVVITGPVAPFRWPGAGWPNSDSIVVQYMYNNGTHGDLVAGDSIWSRDVTFPKYTQLRIEYKYGANFALTTNTGGNDNESSVGTNHFISLTPDIVSGTVHNVWSVMGDHELFDIVLVGVEDQLSSVPKAYSLSQNYPNPFNPSTIIKYQISEAGLVTLKIFNTLGQEVATLVNEQKSAGSYTVNFNAANLSTGVYFYRISSKNFIATKKMLLLK